MGFVKREMHANFCMNITFDVCLNVGGTQSMDIVLLETNVCMHIPKNVVLNVPIITEGFANLAWLVPCVKLTYSNLNIRSKLPP